MANTTNLNLVKPIGTDHALISDINGNSDKIDAYAGKVNTGLDGLRDGIAIVSDGNTHGAITSGQFVYVKNHNNLPEGLYRATANVAANGTLSSSNVTADSSGGLNTLNEQIGKNVVSVEFLSEAIKTAEMFSFECNGIVYIYIHYAVCKSPTLAKDTWREIAEIPSAYRPISYAGGSCLLTNVSGNIIGNIRASITSEGRLQIKSDVAVSEDNGITGLLLVYRKN